MANGERPADLLSALRGSFLSTYLTLTSIIQGVALAYLVVVVDDEMKTFESAHWLLVATTFLIIAAAWHEYMTAVTVFVWIPRLLDSLIPFFLGGSEVILIWSLRGQSKLEWSFLAAGSVALVTLIAFVNMYRSAAGEEDEINRAVLEKIHLYRWLNLAFVAFSGVIFLSFSLIEALAAPSAFLDTAFAATALGLVVTFLARGVLYWNRIIDVARQG
jgi:hypothetical protein